jgi:hypothetical protein
MDEARIVKTDKEGLRTEFLELVRKAKSTQTLARLIDRDVFCYRFLAFNLNRALTHPARRSTTLQPIASWALYSRSNCLNKDGFPAASQRGEYTPNPGRTGVIIPRIRRKNCALTRGAP